MSIEGLVTRDLTRKTFSVQIRVANPHGRFVGERALESKAADCGALTAAIVLVVALVIDPEAGRDGLPADLLPAPAELAIDDPATMLLAELERNAKQAAAPAPVSMDSVTATAPRRPAVSDSVAVPIPPRPRVRRYYAELSVAPVLAFGVLPQLGIGGGGMVRITTPTRLAVRVAGFGLFPRTRAAVDSDTKRDDTHFRASFGELATCLSWFRSGPLRLDTCLGVALGALRARGDSTLHETDSTRRLFTAPVAHVALHYRLRGAWFVELAQSFATLLPRDRYSYTDSSGVNRILFRTEALSGWTTLALGYRL